MKIINGETIQEVYAKLVNELFNAPKIGDTKEITNCALVVNRPSIEDYILPYRKLSEKYLNAELDWYWTGDNSCKTIGKYAKMWKEISDDGITNNSAYGYILFKKYMYNQLEMIIDLLEKDKNTRRAVLNISDPTLDKINTKDMQCTIAIQFMIRNNKLCETVYMRSNDIYFGLPYDYVFFVSLAKYISERLNIELGEYTHIAGSIHMYNRDENKFVPYTVEPINIDLADKFELYYRDVKGKTK